MVFRLRQHDDINYSIIKLNVTTQLSYPHKRTQLNLHANQNSDVQLNLSLSLSFPVEKEKQQSLG